MSTLKRRIQTLVNEGQIQDEKEREELKRLLREMKWNPYFFRHSAITHDSDYLSGYALNKKVRWTMTSKQPARYIKNRMGDPFPIVGRSTKLSTLASILRKERAVLIVDKGRLAGIITQYDLVDKAFKKSPFEFS